MAPEMIDRILSMAERGVSSGVISRLTGVTRHAVYRCKLAVGAPRTRLDDRRREYYRNGVAVCPFSAAEDDRITQLRIDGHSLRAIGRAIGRHKSTVALRLMALAREGDRPCPTP